MSHSLHSSNLNSLPDLKILNFTNNSRRLRCWEKLVTCKICRQPLQWELYNNNRWVRGHVDTAVLILTVSRCRLQDPDHRTQWRASQTTDLGHCRPGEVQDHHQHLLQGNSRGHRRLRRHQRREFRQRKAVAARNWPKLWRRQPDTGGQQERWSGQKGGGGKCQSVTSFNSDCCRSS